MLFREFYREIKCRKTERGRESAKLGASSITTRPRREREKIDLVRKKNHRPHGKNKSHPSIPRSLWCICSNIFVNVEFTEDELGAIFFKKVLFKASFQMHTGDR